MDCIAHKAYDGQVHLVWTMNKEDLKFYEEIKKETELNILYQL